jgi:nicotinamidase-related amidase
MQALLSIDIQNDYFPGGRMELDGALAAGANAGRLLTHFRKLGRPVIHIQHLSLRPGATYLLPGTTGADVHDSVAPQAGEIVLQKNFPNSFRCTALQSTLQELGIKELLVGGMMTHMCVDTTVRAAFDLGYVTTVAHDACATRDLSFNGQHVAAAEVHASYMAALAAVFAKTVPTDEVIAVLA